MISLLIHRPTHNLNTLHSVLYFLPIYLIGIYCSIHKNLISAKIENLKYYLLILALVLTFLQTTYGNFGNYYKSNLFDYKSIDLMFIQKLYLTLFLFALFTQFENFKNRYIDLIANQSFSIFFLHPIIILFINEYINIQFLNPWIRYIFLIIFTISSCIVITFLFKLLFKEKSKYLIGY
jgi:membrane-bound acyltransferase YfiQ involved in biofilm formation